MSQLRNIAVSGVTTQEQYNKVITLCGDTQSNFNFYIHARVIYDNIDSEQFMHNWDEQDYSHCTLYTYEDFIAKFDKKEIPMPKLELQEPVVFTTMKELREAVDLGLEVKDLYLNGTYDLPMLQGIKHGDHMPLVDVASASNLNSILQVTAGQKALDWKDVRHKYIKPKTKMTLAQIEEALGYKVELI